MNTALTNQLNDLKAKVKDKQTKLQEYSTKNKAMFDLSKKLTEGYVSSISIIIDLSTLLAAYKDIVDDVSHMLDSINVSDTSLDNLKTETNTKLAQIKDKFATEHARLATMLKNSKNETFLQNLDNIKRMIDNPVSGGRVSIQKTLQQVFEKK